MLELEAGGEEDLTIAGFTRDAAEVHGGQPSRAVSDQRFGKPLATLVRVCSDSVGTDPEGTAPWLERKRVQLANMQRATVDVMLGTVAHTFHSVCAILTDIQM